MKALKTAAQHLQCEVIYFFEIVAPYSVVSISGEDHPAVLLVGQTLDAHALPVVDDVALQVLR